jgi:MFS superfamily sulfate permease-like transporter
MAGVIVRSTANVQSGGKSRVSAILHGVWLLLFIAVFAFLLETIPTSVLAAILVYTGYKLIDPRSIGELKRFGWSEVAIYAATVIVIVTVDLLSGILTGIFLAGFKLLHALSGLHTEFRSTSEAESRKLVLSGAATFMGLPRLADKLDEVPDGSEVEISFENLHHIDYACIDLLRTWSEQHEATGGTVHIDWDSLARKYDAQPA